jgi:predicted O-methyltransferase YrrM
MNIMSDPSVQAVLEEYRIRVQSEDALRKALPRQEWLRRRDEFLLEVGEATAIFMNVLIREAQAKTILEVGTSYGYSTMWLAEAARATGGTVLTVDLSAEKQTYAKSMLEKAELAPHVEFHNGDALAVIGRLDAVFDFVLIDLWKNVYIPCFDAVRQKIAPDAIIVADNMIFPPDNHESASAYRTHVRAAGMDSVLLPVGHGIEVSRTARK